MKEFLIGPNDGGQRLDKFAEKATVGLPRSLLYKAVRTKKIKVNRKRCEPGQILAAGDTVQMFLSPEFFGEKDLAFLRLGYSYGGKSAFPSYFSAGLGVKYSGFKLDATYLLGSAAIGGTLGVGLGYCF